MNKKELTEYATNVALKLQKELPSKGVSLMITSDGEGAVVCHMLGSAEKFVEVVAKTLSVHKQCYNYIKLAITGADLMKALKNGATADVEISDLSESLKSNLS